MATDIAQLTQQLHDEIEQTPERYRPLLLRLVHSFREGVEHEIEDVDPRDSLRQALREVKAGQTQPLAGMWERVGL